MMTRGWKETLLGEVLTERRETPTPESLENGEVSIVSKIGFNQGKIELRSDGKTKTGMILIRPGDLVISGINAAKGAIAIYDEKQEKPIAGTIHYGSYIPNKERVEVKYLWWFLRSAAFREIVQHHIPGGIKTELKSKRFLSVPIPLPPLGEQRHIVERVEALVARIAKAQSLREEASQEVDYLYGREVAELFTNSKDWQTYNLGELTTDVSYGTSEKAHSERIGTPVFRMGNIQSGKLDLSDMKYMHPSQQELKKLTLQKGDILVNRTNSAELVGKCAVFDLDGDYLFASYIIRLRIDTQKANPYLVAEYINSPLGRAYMFAERKQMTGQANVNSQKLKALPIKLPPLDEQRRIVAYLDSVQARLASLRELQSATEEELSALLPSVLDKAFKGEL
jgi:type I restriction enzyme S subunit